MPLAHFAGTLVFLAANHLPAATVVNFTGNVSQGEGVVGHGALSPPPAPFEASTGAPLGSHPQGGTFLSTVYTLLAGRDVFSTVDGSEAMLSTHPVPFASSAGGSPLSGLGIDGPLYLSFRGLELDTDSSADYRYDTVNDLEYRTYRNGLFEFYHDPGGGPMAFARTGDVRLDVTIDWNTFSTEVTMSGTPLTGSGLLAMVASGTGVIGAPVDESGFTSEGTPFTGSYGLYDDNSSYSFEKIPEPGSAILVLLGILNLARGRRRGHRDRTG